MDKIDHLTRLRVARPTRVKLHSCQPLQCYVFTPKDPRQIRQVLIAVHGIKRDTSTLLAGLSDICSATSTALIVPVFSRKNFPAYQRIADSPDQLRPDWLLNAFIEQWKLGFALPSLAIHLFGFSGGAQFCHRYAYLNATRVASMTLASAGWYTLPTTQIDYPYGLNRVPGWLGKMRLTPALKLSTATLVGECDIDRDAAVRKGRQIDRLQGETRIERAHAWCQFLNRSRAELQLGGPEDAVQLVPAVAHDAGSMIRSDLFRRVMLKTLTEGMKP